MAIKEDLAGANAYVLKLQTLLELRKRTTLPVLGFDVEIVPSPAQKQAFVDDWNATVANLQALVATFPRV